MPVHDDGSIGGRADGSVLGADVPASGLERGAKRLFDIIVSAAGLILLSPLFLVVSIAIKLDSRGPVFSREILYGYKNRAIRVRRFRTTPICGEADRIRSRLTQVGRVLQRTAIDRLPHLFDVLGDQMSFVGPRLYVYRQDLFKDRFGRLLDDFKPGMTGLAQINETREFKAPEQLIKDDLYYIENWSLWLDIRIILMTLLNALQPR
jgi:lipopolysaccharide/colanic/teichoic acid biosynthesis glycosyltransferase